MQPARSVVDLAAELSAGVQRGHDHLQRRFVFELWVRIYRNAAAVVAHRQHVVGLQLDLDPRCLAGHRLVHGVVEDFGGEVMQCALIGAADIHAGPAPDRLEAFQNLDVLRRVAARRGSRRCRVEKIG